VISELSQETFQTAELCEALAVSRSAYYDWRTAAPTLYQQQDQKLGPMIKDIFFQHKRRYGARRISVELQEQGVPCSRGKARKIMDQMDLIAIQPKSFQPRTTDSRHTLGYSPNLLMDGVDLDGINQVWVGDITYIGLSNRFAYLALLMDLFSRKVIGWTLEVTMEAALVITALKRAIKSRQPLPGLIHHTDRGGQYAATEYRQILERAGMEQSMSRAGDCYDNAFMESCFGTIKTELEMTTYPSLQQAFQEIQEYINYYNHLRRHSSLAYLSPSRFELAHIS
jgi:putative transposase